MFSAGKKPSSIRTAATLPGMARVVVEDWTDPGVGRQADWDRLGPVKRQLKIPLALGGNKVLILLAIAVGVENNYQARLGRIVWCHSNLVR